MSEKTAKDIMFLKPVFKHTIWGGSKLREDFGYPVEGEDIGECWGISAHPYGDDEIKNGDFAGKKLSEVWEKHPEIFGNPKEECFPLLTKIIDAQDDLSIQVHPDDAYAKVNECGSLGKMECWYVLDCPEDATLIIGHNAKKKDEMVSMVEQGDWKHFLREIPVKKGDFIQINPGTLHAIKGGFVILETQQSSDVTYRVYDYDRLSDGKKRPLHIKQSMDVTTVPAEPLEEMIRSTIGLPVNEWNLLYSCKYYDVFKLEVNGKMVSEQKYPFLLMSVVDGSGGVNGLEVKKGDHFIIPDGLGMIELDGDMVIIASSTSIAIY